VILFIKLKIQLLIVQTKSNVSHFDLMQYLHKENGLRSERSYLRVQTNISWHIPHALRSLDNPLIIFCFFFWSNSKDMSEIIIFSKIRPFRKTYLTNKSWSCNPWNPWNWTMLRWDTRQPGTLRCGAHLSTGDCSCRQQSTWIR
jgi:hypothetical protein